MEYNNEKDAFLQLLDKLIATTPSHFFVSVPISGYSLLDNFPRLVFIESGELICDIGKNGSITQEYLPQNSVLFGLKGGATGVSSHNTYSGRSFTIGFFDEYIRFVYYTFKDGRPVDFFFYHTSEPLCNAGIMALEALRNISGNPDLEGAKFDFTKAILELSRYQLLNPRKEKISKSFQTWQKIESYIEQHFMEEEISRKAIAREFLMNESYLSTLCQINTNHTLHDLILRKKLAYSLLLLEQNMTIGEIASQCGFNQTGYFIQVFRKNYGVSPGKYRTNVLQRGKQD